MLVFFLTSLARADAVPEPPDDCPRGSIGVTGHSGPYCRPSECSTGCPEGTSCESTSLCVTTSEQPCGGRPYPEGEAPCTYTHIEARKTCATQSDCEGTAVCQKTNRCAKPASMCGCASSGPPTLFVLLGLLPLAVRRSRRGPGAVDGIDDRLD